MNKTERRKGFTLIELIVVIAILAILAFIAVPRVFTLIERSRIAADQATVRVLNSVTPVARINVSASDPFEDESKESEELIQFLVEEEYLASAVEPKSKDASFMWSFEDERWYLFSLTHSSVFLSLNDLMEGYLHSSGDYTGVLGFRPGAHTRFQGSATEVFIPKEVDGQAIKGIYQDFFRYGSDYRPGNKLTSISFDPDSEIKIIHARAFQDNNLTQVHFHDGLEEIHLRAFIGNDNLNKISIGSNVKIQDNAFGNRTDSFREAYKQHGAGSFIWDGENWIRE